MLECNLFDWCVQYQNWDEQEGGDQTKTENHVSGQRSIPNLHWSHGDKGKFHMWHEKIFSVGRWYGTGCTSGSGLHWHVLVYSSWIGWRDNTYGLIFNEGLFFKYKVWHLSLVVLDHLCTSGFKNVVGTHVSSSHGQGHSSLSWGGSNIGWESFQQSPFVQHPSLQATSSHISNPQNFPHPLQAVSSFHPLRCYLCGGQHVQWDYQGPSKWLITNDQGKWVDKALGNKIIYILFNIGPGSCWCTTCAFSHSCSLCSDTSHGCSCCSL